MEPAAATEPAGRRPGEGALADSASSCDGNETVFVQGGQDLGQLPRPAKERVVMRNAEEGTLGPRNNLSPLAVALRREREGLVRIYPIPEVEDELVRFAAEPRPRPLLCGPEGPSHAPSLGQEAVERAREVASRVVGDGCLPEDPYDNGNSGLDDQPARILGMAGRQEGELERALVVGGENPGEVFGAEQVSSAKPIFEE